MDEIIDALNAISPADVAPVVHGRWVQKKEWHLGRWVAWLECSECGEHDDNLDMYEMMPFCNLSNYCPGCGAKMDYDVVDNNPSRRYNIKTPKGRK